MKVTTELQDDAVARIEDMCGQDPSAPLALCPATSRPSTPAFSGVVVGALLGLRDGQREPLVSYAGQPGSAAVCARSVIDLDARQIGKQVVLVFEGADAAKPIIVGVLRDGDNWPLAHRPGQVEVDADGDSLVVSAKQQLVLRCGDASITLNRTGKIVIRGTYVSSRSSGVNRLKGGSVEIN